MEHKKIFIIGGSGSLGNALVKTYGDHNEIIVYSRDECKHWDMRLRYPAMTIRFIIGDVRDKRKLSQSLRSVKPHVIIIAAALKHIDKCETDTHECISTNILGTMNIIDVIQEEQEAFHDTLDTVCFISTDKACSPVNTYGMSKAISENYMIEASIRTPQFRFVIVRYGNVLNSRGSIIPILHRIGQDATKTFFPLTDPSMTRFVMTLDQSVDLIEHAILHAPSGHIVIPHLVSMKVADLISIFSELYQKPVCDIGLRPGEKILESLINPTQSKRLDKRNPQYIYIKPCHLTTLEDIRSNEFHDYNSLINPMSRDELYRFLSDLSLLSPTCTN